MHPRHVIRTSPFSLFTDLIICSWKIIHSKTQWLKTTACYCLSWFGSTDWVLLGGSCLGLLSTLTPKRAPPSGRHLMLVDDRKFTSVQFRSLSVVSDSLQPHGLQHARLPCPSSTPRACSNSCPSNQWCHPTITSPSLPAFNFSQHQGLFQWVSSFHQVAKVLELQHQSFQWIFRVDFL